ncbi:MAG: alpha/beta hydrolase [Gammaproteobacteria bacterium]
MSLRRGLGRWVVRRLLRPSLSPALAMAERRRRAEMLAGTLPSPAGVKVEAGHVGGLPGEWLLPKDATPGLACLYCHGGGFVLGSPKTHRAAAARLARAASMDTFVLDYRLAPEFPFPAARDDVLAGWRDLCRRTHLHSIVMAGDSAGGTLAVSATMVLQQVGEQGPAALALFSPLLDLTLPSPPAGRTADLMLPEDFVTEAVDAYRAGRPADDPALSPLLGSLDGLPPTLVTVDAAERLGGDARRLAARCPEQVELLEAEGLWHAWPLMAGLVPEANETLAKAGRFLAVHAAGG